MIRVLPHRRGLGSRGVAAIEFALLAPVLAVLICGTIDLGYIYMAQTSLTGAVAAAGRESASTQELTQTARDQAMRATIMRVMSGYISVDGRPPAIVTTVYHNFSETRPEDYTDLNHNGHYDLSTGEPFVDRNGNGVWDPDLPVANSVTGTEGDVVTYTATYQIQHLFGFLTQIIWQQPGMTLTATSVIRNEPVKTE